MKKSDISLIVGLGGALAALIMGFMLEGGNPLKLLSLSSIIIILGGTLGACIVSYGLTEVFAIPTSVGRAMTAAPHDFTKIVDLFINFAEKARREGLLSLESDIETELNDKSYDPLVKRGLSLVVDGTDGAAIQGIFEVEIAEYEERMKGQVELFAQAGGFSPTMGIIGTVMGLVITLGNLSEPERLGESISAAFIATLYGIILANLFWLPVANKLKAILKGELEMKNLILTGVISLQAGDNPRIVRDKLIGYISESHREKVVSTEG
jgi:chemotaxis protein MotA